MYLSITIYSEILDTKIDSKNVYRIIREAVGLAP